MGSILLIACGTWLGAVAADEPAPPSGAAAAGNVDGVLTWRLGGLEPGKSARSVALLAFDKSADDATRRLEKARERFVRLPSLRAANDAAAPTRSGGADPRPPGQVWVRSDHTDFALEDTGYFRWDLTRQSLAGAQGGQLSQFVWYVHYGDADGRHRAGAPNVGESPVENLQVVEPIRRLGNTTLAGVVATTDRKLRVEITAVLGEGTDVAVELRLTNTGDQPLVDMRLSAYANVEVDHTHEDDLALLDARSGGLLFYDPASGGCVIVSGLERPASGYAGTWNSLAAAQSGDGIALDQWQPFDPQRIGPLRKQLARALAAAQGILLPYRHAQPQTPPLRTLSAAEETAALERDWVFQAGGHPWAERARREIDWARQLAARLAAQPGAPDLRPSLAELDRLAQQLPADGATDAAARQAYLSVRAVKRRIAMANPALDFAQVLLIDQPMPSGPVNDTHQSIHRMGITATPGGRLLALDGLRPGGRVRQLAPERPGSFWRPDLSFDGQRVLFCYKPHDGKSFHLYETNLDGTGLRQLTDGDYDDIDPLYLPDGHILFTTTRGNSHVRCGPFIYSYILARCDADGRNIYLISYNGEPDYVPALLNDGRVIYSRWEYTDKPLWRVQSLWTTNQDGTHTSAFWGNQSVWPDHLCEPRPIPGSNRVMFSGVGHHDWFSGSIGIVDPAKGRNFPQGLTKVTADLRWPECSTPPVDPIESPHYHASGPYTGYKTPYPLTAEDFLVSARGADGKFRLYLMDVHGNRELIFEGAHQVWHALPIRRRAAPPRQPDLVAWPGTGKDRRPAKPGVFYCGDVYEGVPDLQRGAVKWLRVWQLDYKTYTTWTKTYRHSGPPVSIVQEEGVKRILSEVPVESDGSAYFQVPAGRSLYFQLLDQDYRCLHTMRSFTGAMPGERRSCVGCHEHHSAAPPSATGLALRRPPSELSPPPWGTESIGYERFVQPVLDRYCGKCHSGQGEARAVLDLTLRPGHNVFKEPYLTLVGPAGWSNPVPDRGQPGYGIAGAIPVEAVDPTLNDPKAYSTLRPGRYLSATSKLLQLATSGQHYGVRVDALAARRLAAWIDACCPYQGEPEIRAIDDPDFVGIEDLPIRPRVKTAPVIERP